MGLVQVRHGALPVYSWCLSMDGWPGLVDMGGWLYTEAVYLPAECR